MQHAVVRGARPVAQMFGPQARAAPSRERRGPRDPRAGPPARIARVAPLAFPPSKTAACGSGGIRSMAQRFFSGSGITPFTGVIPTGSGGR